MRPIGYVAAAAAGVIAPIAFALPALAATQSPILHGAGSIVSSADGENGPDNNDGNGYNYDDNGPWNDHGDNWNDSDPDVNVYASGSVASGDVSFIVDIDDAGPFNEYELNSPALDAGCDSNDITGALAESDRFGHLNVAGDANNCIPGDYQIAVYQTGSAEETYYGTVTVH